MVVLGFDPGTNWTGYRVVKKNGSGYKHIANGFIHPENIPSSMLHKKLKFFFDEISVLIEKFNPDAVSIENIFTGINVKSALIMAHLRGVIMLAVVQKNVELFEYSPREIKLAVTGCGSASKEQVKQMVKILLNLSSDTVIKGNDSSDALAAAICHINNDTSSRSYV